MKKYINLLLTILLFISCNTNKSEKIINENCYITLKSVSNVTEVYDERNKLLTQMRDEIRAEKNIDTINIKKIKSLSKKINEQITLSLKILKGKETDNKNEEIFDVSIKYLTKVKELENKIPLLIKELSDNAPDINFRLKESISKITAEVIQLGNFYHDAMNRYYKEHNMSDKKLDSIEKAVERN